MACTEHPLRPRVRHALLWLACGSALACSSAGGQGGEPPPDDPDDPGDSGDPEIPPRAGGDPDAECVEVGPTPLRRLTHTQYDHAVRDLLGLEGSPSAALAGDEKVGAFFSNSVAPVSDLMVEQYAETAEALAAEAVDDIDTLVPCDPDDGEACAEEFIVSLGLRAHRRPLDAEQRAAYLQLFNTVAEEGEFADGIRVVVQAMLQSPYFLYQVEATVADDSLVPLDPYEVASRLSFFLWNTTPDEALYAAAADGALETEAEVRAHAERLLDDPRAKDAIAAFHHQWLGLDGLETSVKDADTFPAFDDSLRAAMLEETARFADYVIREDDGRLATLLTAPFSFPEGPVREIYGLTDPAPDSGPSELDPSERGGILTHPSWLATHAHSNQSSPVQRGVVVRQNLLCTQLPTPPANVNNTAPDPSPDATTRERFAEHTENPECAGCHVLIDGIGFGLEHYDAVGAFRSEENGIPVDATGELLGTDDADGEFVGAIELGERLAGSDQLRACVANQWFAFAKRQPASAQDACSMDRIDAAFAADDYNIRDLMLAVAISDSFRFTSAQD